MKRLIKSRSGNFQLLRPGGSEEGEISSLYDSDIINAMFMIPRGWIIRSNMFSLSFQRKMRT